MIEQHSVCRVLSTAEFCCLHFLELSDVVKRSGSQKNLPVEHVVNKSAFQHLHNEMYDAGVRRLCSPRALDRFERPGDAEFDFLFFFLRNLDQILDGSISKESRTSDLIGREVQIRIPGFCAVLGINADDESRNNDFHIRIEVVYLLQRLSQQNSCFHIFNNTSIVILIGKQSFIDLG